MSVVHTFMPILFYPYGLTLPCRDFVKDMGEWFHVGWLVANGKKKERSPLENSGRNVRIFIRPTNTVRHWKDLPASTRLQTE